MRLMKLGFLCSFGLLANSLAVTVPAFGESSCGTAPDGVSLLNQILGPQETQGPQGPKSDPARGRAEFCSRASKPDYIQTLGMDTQNHYYKFDNYEHLSNEGGFLGIGVCWWHSRFQRAAWALSYYRPDLPKPDRKRAQEIIALIASMKSVVEIPGYRNFSEFSKEWPDLIQKKLESWQLKDGIFKFSWAGPIPGVVRRIIKGLDNDDSMNPRKLLERMRGLYRQVHDQKEVAFIKYFPQGVPGSHSLLILDMQPSIREGRPAYEIKVADSEFPGRVLPAYYVEGETAMKYKDPMVGLRYEGLVPTPRNDGDLKKFRKRVASFCGQVASDAAPFDPDEDEGQ